MSWPILEPALAGIGEEPALAGIGEELPQGGAGVAAGSGGRCLGAGIGGCFLGVGTGGRWRGADAREALNLMGPAKTKVSWAVPAETKVSCALGLEWTLCWNQRRLMGFRHGIGDSPDTGWSPPSNRGCRSWGVPSAGGTWSRAGTANGGLLHRGSWWGRAARMPSRRWVGLGSSKPRWWTGCVPPFCCGRLFCHVLHGDPREMRRRGLW